ncbi:MAG TPA: hypothetical protein VIL42_11095 [Sphingomicrobium sp.]|jgi:hypothetical protein
MTKPIASLRFNARGVAAAAALAVSALTLTATAGPAWAHPAGESADRFSYVLFGSGDSSSTMNGGSGDWARAKALRTAGEPLLYFRNGGSAYVIRDAATLRRANELMEPQRALGARQSALGEQQSALGRRQAALGQLMANARLSELSELGRQQSALGAQQAALGRQQGDLGREQARLSHIASDRLRALVADALSRGLAQRVD